MKKNYRHDLYICLLKPFFEWNDRSIPDSIDTDAVISCNGPNIQFITIVSGNGLTSLLKKLWILGNASK